jgi:hypothetical protein
MISFGAVPGHPLVRGLAADALRFGGLRDRPAVQLDPGDQQLPAKDIETGRTMRQESLLDVVVLNTRNIGLRLSLVNNVSGNHS